MGQEVGGLEGRIAVQLGPQPGCGQRGGRRGLPAAEGEEDVAVIELSPQQRLKKVAFRVAGEDPCELPWDDRTFLWLYGSTMVEASSTQEGDVLLKAFLVIGPHPNEELETDLLWLSAGLDIGRLELDEDDDVILTHRVSASRNDAQLDRELRAFCSLADGLDDLLCARFGGCRSLEHFEQAVQVAMGAGEGPAETVLN